MKRAGLSIPIRGVMIEIPTNYDPENHAYFGEWRGKFKRQWSNNPAWCLWHLIHFKRCSVRFYIARDRVPLNRFDFYSAGRWCDCVGFITNCCVKTNDDARQLAKHIAASLGFWDILEALEKEL